MALGRPQLSKKTTRTLLDCKRYLWRKPTPRWLHILLVCQGVFLLLLLILYMSDSLKAFTYLTRPMWDHPDKAFEVLPHYYAEGVDMGTLCRLHTWTPRTTPNKVVDAIIFANELDLLEIRLKELLPVVDQFFIVESDKTFTSKPKPKLFHENRERFAFAADKIVYGLFEAPEVTKEQSMDFTLENMLRGFVTDLLRKNGVTEGDVVLMADVDEIPSRHTMALFRNCEGFPRITHLGLRNYLYSFEFPLTHQAGFLTTSSPNSYQWRSQVHIWNSGTYYRHGRSSDVLLAESGWHCSFCFRHLDDFIFKMTSYSHSDRVRHEHFLDRTRIQRIICKGADIYDMPLESYTFYDVILNWYDPRPTWSSVNLPTALVQDADRFAFLLPGNCARED